METKTCKFCQQEMPATSEFFYILKNGKCQAGRCRKCKSKYYHENREARLAKSKEYQQNNPEKVRAQAKARYARPEVKAREREWYRERYQNNPNFRLKKVLRARMGKAIEGNMKAADTFTLLGCSLEEFRVHIEGQFQEGMSWDNYTVDGWHIDHIKPCASFDLTDPEQQRQCFHYTNLQPLWAAENLSKNAKWEEE